MEEFDKDGIRKRRSVNGDRGEVKRGGIERSMVVRENKTLAQREFVILLFAFL